MACRRFWGFGRLLARCRRLGGSQDVVLCWQPADPLSKVAQFAGLTFDHLVLAGVGLR
jgi:hypothetical protein